MKISDELRGEIRAAISNAYYHARNEGQTMEVAADSATTSVVTLIEKAPYRGLPDQPQMPEFPIGLLDAQEQH